MRIEIYQVEKQFFNRHYFAVKWFLDVIIVVVFLFSCRNSIYNPLIIHLVGLWFYVVVNKLKSYKKI